MRRKINRSTSLAACLLVACSPLGLGSCKGQNDDGGEWIELPGGRMVQTLPAVDYDEERLIYKIDDDRYFTMMTSEGDCWGLGGQVRYRDEGRGIDSKVGDTQVNDLQIFSLLEGKNLAVPVSNGDLQNNSRILFSTDYGQTWSSINFVYPGAGMVVKGEVMVFLEGIASVNSGVEIDGARVWPFSSLERFIKTPDENTPRSDSYIFRPKENRPPFSENVWMLSHGIHKEDEADVKIDIGSYPDLAPPSGWRYMRCEPMPKKSAEG